jgi:hypothetical protein
MTSTEKIRWAGSGHRSETGPNHARNIGCAGLTECLDCPLQDIGELPVEANAIERQPIDNAPTASRQ